MVKKKITIEQIVSFAEAEFSKPLETSVDVLAASFDDLLHQVVNSTRRVTSKNEAQDLCKLFHRLIILCEEKTKSNDKDNANRWKMLTLALVYKRYHTKAPEAKHEKAEAAAAAAQLESELGERNNQVVVSGQGERLIFYTALACLFQYAATIEKKLTTKEQKRATDALNCLAEIAPHAGGTRDVCTFIEIGVRSILSNFISRYNDQLALIGETVPSSTLVSNALKTIVVAFEEEDKKGGKGGTYSCLRQMLGLTAKTLDRDLDIIKEDEERARKERGDNNNENVQTRELPSTFNVFIPHNERGKQSNKRKRGSSTARSTRNAAKNNMSNRHLVQSVTEILLWSRTTVAMTNGAFTSAYNGILQSDSSEMMDSHSSSSQKEFLFRMQTIIRNIRKVLNTYSRKHGFMLGNQFVMDGNDSSITAAMLRTAKAGDLANLTRLARKKQAVRVLKLINLRYAQNPSRVSPVESIGELVSSWVALGKEQDDNMNDDNEECGPKDIVDELTQMELDIQKWKVRATIEKLRSMRTQDDHSDTRERPVVIATLDNSLYNSVASVLMAAAMSDWALEEDDIVNDKVDDPVHSQQLYLRETLMSVPSFPGTMKLLNTLIAGKDSSGNEEPTLIASAPSFVTSDGVATTKAVMNLIDRHVMNGNILLLFTSADLRLPDDVMESLTKRGCSLHCHDADTFGKRLNREGAKSGDITISLAWDTEDDLDLHVIMPSGEELFYGCTNSKCGLGMLDVDMNAFIPYSKEPVENVFFGDTNGLIQAPHGKYKVFVQNYGYHTRGKDSQCAVPWRVLVEINGKKSRYFGECKGSGESSNVTVCEFDYKGRTVPFPKELEASAFSSSKLVNITASTGGTLESLIQVMGACKEHKELNRVRELVEEEEAVEAMEEDNDSLSPQPQDRRPLMTNHLEVTSRDQLYMQLCKLPPRFHRLVELVFEGGATLAEKCASDIARNMMKDSIHISELELLGYPSDIVERVKGIMKKGSAPASA